MFDEDLAIFDTGGKMPSTVDIILCVGIRHVSDFILCVIYYRMITGIYENIERDKK